jgi:hypothetical protein
VEDANSQQQQQQQIQAVSSSGVLSGCILHLFGTIFALFKDDPLALPAWRALLLPAARLGVSVLQAWPASAVHVKSSSRSSSSSTCASTQRTATAAAARSSNRSHAGSSASSAAAADVQRKTWLASCICRAIKALQYVFMTGIQNSKGDKAVFAQLAAGDVTGAVCVIRLLYISLAWAVREMWKKHGGKSPVVPEEASIRLRASSSSSSSSSSSGSGHCSSRDRQQQQKGLQVPAYHEQYLAALGGPILSLSDAQLSLTVQSSFMLCMLQQVVPLTCMHRGNSCANAAFERLLAFVAGPQAAVADAADRVQDSAAGLASWRQLEITQGLISAEQVLLLIEWVMFLEPEYSCGVIQFMNSSLTLIQQEECLTSAAELLLPPLLQLLGPAMLHAAASIQQKQQQQQGCSSGSSSSSNEAIKLHAGYPVAVRQMILSGKTRTQTEQTRIASPKRLAVPAVTPEMQLQNNHCLLHPVQCCSSGAALFCKHLQGMPGVNVHLHQRFLMVMMQPQHSVLLTSSAVFPACAYRSCQLVPTST